MRVPEAEASGDNDEAEIGLRDKSLKTTVEQLKYRLSQAEKEIVALKRYQSPQKCQSHGRCEILQRDLLTWQDKHENRISSQIVRWQLAERRRIHDEMENMRKVYDNIERHLEVLEKRSAKSYFDFQRQIDAWEKRLKEDVISLHESNLSELWKQFRAWSEMQNTINSSEVRKKKSEVYDCEDTTAKNRDDSNKPTNFKLTASYENNAKFLRRIEHIIKVEVQRNVLIPISVRYESANTLGELRKSSTREKSVRVPHGEAFLLTLIPYSRPATTVTEIDRVGVNPREDGREKKRMKKKKKKRKKDEGKEEHVTLNFPPRMITGNLKGNCRIRASKRRLQNEHNKLQI
ncbi:hypothetical protein G5I_00687 [Acromyrmex echinatior]|uniref:Uncharacterized protein n=1 Tax=Acromyrmex echinatior TaxID=103372 RepID=F4W5J0_ACREC|nr:hypothetical protein G5I_00687 [Acromyrmex echinatior]